MEKIYSGGKRNVNIREEIMVKGDETGLNEEYWTHLFFKFNENPQYKIEMGTYAEFK